MHKLYPAVVIFSISYLLIQKCLISMSASGTSEDLPSVTVSHTGGATLKVYLHGATITSLKTSKGQELLFVSSKAIFDGEKAIRGGIPIVFPQFGTNGPLPQHGLVRTRPWKLVSSGDGSAEFGFEATEETKSLWPHDFQLRYRIQFDDTRLVTILEVVNPKGSESSFSFDALLHTYFYVGENNAPKVEIKGLRGVRYISKPEGGLEREEEHDSIIIDKEIDRVYMNTPADVTITGIASGTSDEAFNTVTIKRTGYVREASHMRAGMKHAPLDVVVWNAWEERCKAIADFGDSDYMHYVCVEPGRVSAATAEASANKALAPGFSWTLKQEISLTRS